MLFVVDTFQAGFTAANPGPGAVVVYPVNSDGSLGTNIANGNLPYWPVQFNPSSVNVTALTSTNAPLDFVYVVNTNTAAQAGTISAFSFSTGSGGGPLTPIAGSPFPAGVAPNASASDPTGRFFYTTDSATNQLIAYGIQTSGVLVPVQNGPFKTDVFPDAVTVSPNGMFIYVANYNSNDISAYTIDQGTGAPSSLASASLCHQDRPHLCDD